MPYGEINTSVIAMAPNETPKPITQNPTPQISSWNDLEVWQFAHSAVLRTYEITKGFPSDERYRLIDQLCRAAASVPANIAEGKGRSSLKEYLQFLSIARGSVEEVKYFLLLARDLKYLPDQAYDEINETYTRVGKMLNGLMSSLRRHLTPKTRHRTPDTQDS
jgi:four helix bundle protein